MTTAARHKVLSADYGGAHRPEPERRHDEIMSWLLERRLVPPHELDDFTADESRWATYSSMLSTISSEPSLSDWRSSLSRCSTEDFQMTALVQT